MYGKSDRALYLRLVWKKLYRKPWIFNLFVHFDRTRSFEKRLKNLRFFLSIPFPFSFFNAFFPRRLSTFPMPFRHREASMIFRFPEAYPSLEPSEDSDAVAGEGVGFQCVFWLFSLLDCYFSRFFSYGFLWWNQTNLVFFRMAFYGFPWFSTVCVWRSMAFKHLSDSPAEEADRNEFSLWTLMLIIIRNWSRLFWWMFLMVWMMMFLCGLWTMGSWIACWLKESNRFSSFILAGCSCSDGWCSEDVSDLWKTPGDWLFPKIWVPPNHPI